MTPPDEDLFAPEVIADPYTYFGRLRETDPVHWNPVSSLWIITRHEDLTWLVRHHELFSSAVIRNDPRPPYPPIEAGHQPLFEAVRTFRADQLVEQDRPGHLAMRNAVHEYFTPTAMESWRPFVRRAVADLLDEAAPAGGMEVLTTLAAPLPVRIITEMMGVPNDDREHLRALADKLLYINRGEPNRMAPLMEGISGMIDYVAPKVDIRAREPANDFISVLARAEPEGVFTRHQVLVNTALLLFAGHETTM
ncbi:MAG: cytochrome P450, partial [Gemmatimonadales bacterium]